MRLASAVAPLLLAALAAPAETRSIPIESGSDLQAHAVKAEGVEFKGRKALRVTEVPASGGHHRLVILPGVELQNGSIEAEVAGEPGTGSSETARGFVGIAFHVAPDASKFECFYLRPTNGRADDQVRRNHSAQYVSEPEFPWQRLRKEFPEKYESYVDLAPGEWTKVRIEVSGSKARLFVHDSAQPVLLVNDLKLGETKGGVALWIGSGTRAHFRAVKVSQ